MADLIPDKNISSSNPNNTQPNPWANDDHVNRFLQQRVPQPIAPMDASLYINVSNPVNDNATCMAPGVYGRSTQERLFPKFNYKNTVFIVTCVQFVIYFFTMDNSLVFDCILYKFGAEYAPSIIVYNHYHRLILPIFLHASLSHVSGNMFYQNMYGHILEEYYGRKKLILLYIASGIGGNLLMTVRQPKALGVGASSALYGVLALSLAYIIENYQKFGSRRRVVLLIVLALIITGFIPSQGVGYDAHIGGFISGWLLAVIYSTRPGNASFNYVKILAGLGLIAYYAATFGWIISKKYSEDYDEFKDLADEVIRECNWYT
mmetsp:Transcript_5364/g.5782  ORF Transcript_5364/g.5782 Transcript_5364/m.5782 type:complete len:319 (-) Transcript_5364:139-1095(-)|eukprot:CAMPEP_0176425856 /NCGR_PEP_ID=MMETSP0127-20121128/11617_1 /TAXON_ID=938130 /ORGANISM="Platyophrya macrostoma, Strain WH" /LENGTH=318 /DNA_ID=CAMNT_0017807055 /DNA_START=35 /DNA_END=991 /DNA_ORIENTATION=+